MTKNTKANDKPPGHPKGLYYEESLPTRIANMQMGDCESKSIRIPLAEATVENIRSKSESLSASVRKAVSRASLRLEKGARFTTDTGTFNTPGRYMVITTVVTRLK